MQETYKMIILYIQLQIS